jgi:hypothetical protein
MQIKNTERKIKHLPLGGTSMYTVHVRSLSLAPPVRPPSTRPPPHSPWPPPLPPPPTPPPTTECFALCNFYYICSVNRQSGNTLRILSNIPKKIHNLIKLHLYYLILCDMAWLKRRGKRREGKRGPIIYVCKKAKTQNQPQGKHT